MNVTIDSIAENMKDEDINFKVGRENVEPEDVPDTNVGKMAESEGTDADSN